MDVRGRSVFAAGSRIVLRDRQGADDFLPCAEHVTGVAGFALGGPGHHLLATAETTLEPVHLSQHTSTQAAQSHVSLWELGGIGPVRKLVTFCPLPDTPSTVTAVGLSSDGLLLAVAVSTRTHGLGASVWGSAQHRQGQVNKRVTLGSLLADATFPAQRFILVWELPSARQDSMEQLQVRFIGASSYDHLTVGSDAKHVAVRRLSVERLPSRPGQSHAQFLLAASGYLSHAALSPKRVSRERFISPSSSAGSTVFGVWGAPSPGRPLVLAAVGIRGPWLRRTCQEVVTCHCSFGEGGLIIVTSRGRVCHLAHVGGCLALVQEFRPGWETTSEGQRNILKQAQSKGLGSHVTVQARALSVLGGDGVSAKQDVWEVPAEGPLLLSVAAWPSGIAVGGECGDVFIFSTGAHADGAAACSPATLGVVERMRQAAHRESTMSAPAAGIAPPSARAYFAEPDGTFSDEEDVSASEPSSKDQWQVALHLWRSRSSPVLSFVRRVCVTQRGRPVCIRGLSLTSSGQGLLVVAGSEPTAWEGRWHARAAAVAYRRALGLWLEKIGLRLGPLSAELPSYALAGRRQAVWRRVMAEGAVRVSATASAAKPTGRASLEQGPDESWQQVGHPTCAYQRECEEGASALERLPPLVPTVDELLGGTGAGADSLLTSLCLRGQGTVPNAVYVGLANAVRTGQQTRRSALKQATGGSSAHRWLAAHVACDAALREDGQVSCQGLERIGSLLPACHGGAVIVGEAGRRMARKLAENGQALLHPALQLRSQVVSGGVATLDIASLVAHGTGPNGQGAFVPEDEAKEAVHGRTQDLLKVAHVLETPGDAPESPLPVQARQPASAEMDRESIVKNMTSAAQLDRALRDAVRAPPDTDIGVLVQSRTAALPDASQSTQATVESMDEESVNTLLQQAGVGVSADAALFVRLTSPDSVAAAHQRAAKLASASSTKDDSSPSHAAGRPFDDPPALLLVSPSVARSSQQTARCADDGKTVSALPPVTEWGEAEIKEQNAAFVEAYQAGAVPGAPSFAIRCSEWEGHATGKQAAMATMLASCPPSPIEIRASSVLGAFGTILQCLTQTATPSAASLVVQPQPSTVGEGRPKLAALDPFLSIAQDIIPPVSAPPVSVVEASWEVMDVHAGGVCDMKLHPGFGASPGRCEVVTVSRDDATVRIWNAHSNRTQLVHVFDRAEAPLGIAWHPGGHLFAVHVPSGVLLAWRVLQPLPRTIVRVPTDSSCTAELHTPSIASFAGGLLGFNARLQRSGSLSLSNVTCMSWSCAGAFLAVGCGTSVHVYGLVGSGASGSGWGRQGSRFRPGDSDGAPAVLIGHETGPVAQAEGMLCLLAKGSGHSGCITSLQWDEGDRHLSAGGQGGAVVVYDTGGLAGALGTSAGLHSGGYSAAAVDAAARVRRPAIDTGPSTTVEAEAVQQARRAPGHRLLVLDPLVLPRVAALSSGPLPGRAWRNLTHISVPLPALWAALGLAGDDAGGSPRSRVQRTSMSPLSRGHPRPKHDVGAPAAVPRSPDRRRRGSVQSMSSTRGSPKTATPRDTSAEVSTDQALDSLPPGLLGTVPRSVWGRGGLFLGIHESHRKALSDHVLSSGIESSMQGIAHMLQDAWSHMSTPQRAKAVRMLRDPLHRLIHGLYATLPLHGSSSTLSAWFGGPLGISHPGMYREAPLGRGEDADAAARLAARMQSAGSTPSAALRRRLLVAELATRVAVVSAWWFSGGREHVCAASRARSLTRHTTAHSSLSEFEQQDTSSGEDEEDGEGPLTALPQSSTVSGKRGNVLDRLIVGAPQRRAPAKSPGPEREIERVLLPQSVSSTSGPPSDMLKSPRLSSLYAVGESAQNALPGSPATRTRPSPSPARVPTVDTAASTRSNRSVMSHMRAVLSEAPGLSFHDTPAVGLLQRIVPGLPGLPPVFPLGSPSPEIPRSFAPVSLTWNQWLLSLQELERVDDAVLRALTSTDVLVGTCTPLLPLVGTVPLPVPKDVSSFSQTPVCGPVPLQAGSVGAGVEVHLWSATSDGRVQQEHCPSVPASGTDGTPAQADWNWLASSLHPSFSASSPPRGSTSLHTPAQAFAGAVLGNVGGSLVPDWQEVLGAGVGERGPADGAQQGMCPLLASGPLEVLKGKMASILRLLTVRRLSESGAPALNSIGAAATTRSVSSLEVTPDGAFLVSAGADGCVFVSVCATPLAAALAAAGLGSNVTAAGEASDDFQMDLSPPAVGLVAGGLFYEDDVPAFWSLGRAPEPLPTNSAGWAACRRSLFEAVQAVLCGAVRHAVQSASDSQGGVTRPAPEAPGPARADEQQPAPKDDRQGDGTALLPSCALTRFPSERVSVGSFISAYNQAALEWSQRVRRRLPLRHAALRREKRAREALAELASAENLPSGVLAAAEPLEGLHLVVGSEVADIRQEVVALRLALAKLMHQQAAVEASLRSDLLSAAEAWRKQVSHALLAALIERDDSRVQSAAALSSVEGYRADIKSKTEGEVNALVQRYERRILNLESEVAKEQQKRREAVLQANEATAKVAADFKAAEQVLQGEFAAAAGDMLQRIHDLERERSAQAARHSEALVQAELVSDQASSSLKARVDDARISLRSSEIANEGKVALLRGTVSTAQASATAAQLQLRGAMRARAAEHERSEELLHQIKAMRVHDEELRKVLKSREARVSTLEAQLADSERERCTLQDEVAYLRGQLEPREQATMALRDTLKGVVEESSAAAREATEAHEAAMGQRLKRQAHLERRLQSALDRAEYAEGVLGSVSKRLSDFVADMPDTKVGLEHALSHLYTHLVSLTDKSREPHLRRALEAGLHASTTAHALKHAKEDRLPPGKKPLSSAVGEFHAQRGQLQRSVDTLRRQQAVQDRLSKHRTGALVSDNAKLLSLVADLRQDNARLKAQLSSASLPRRSLRDRVPAQTSGPVTRHPSTPQTEVDLTATDVAHASPRDTPAVEAPHSPAASPIRTLAWTLGQEHSSPVRRSGSTQTLPRSAGRPRPAGRLAPLGLARAAAQPAD